MGHSQDERAPLLNDNYRGQYGGHGANANRPIYQPDLEFLRREREALDSICHTMSELVFDLAFPRVLFRRGTPRCRCLFPQAC
jgi:hypothetical protein